MSSKESNVTKLAEENKKLEEDVSALQEVLATASAGTSKTSGYKVSGVQATTNTRSSVLASQIWEHGKKGKLFGYKDKSDLQEADVRKGPRDADSDASDANPGARPKSGRTSSRPSTATKTRASSAVTSGTSTSVSKNTKDGPSEPVKIKVLSVNDTKSDASTGKPKDSSSTPAKSLGTRVSSAKSEAPTKESKKHLTPKSGGPEKVADTPQESTRLSDTKLKPPGDPTSAVKKTREKSSPEPVNRKGSAKKTTVGNSTNTKEKDVNLQGCKVSKQKVETGECVSSGQVEDKQDSRRPSQEKTDIHVQRKASTKSQSVFKPPSPSLSDRTTKPAGQTGSARRHGSAPNKESKQVNSGCKASTGELNTEDKQEKGSSQAIKKGGARPKSGKTASPDPKSVAQVDKGNPESVSSRSVEQKKGTPSERETSNSAKPNVTLTGQETSATNRSASNPTRVAKAAADKVNPNKTKKEASKGVGTKASQVSSKSANQRLSTKEGNPETKQTIAVVKEKDEETRQAEREAARLLTQERQRRLHLARSPTTLISLDDDERPSDRTKSRGSSAKKNKKVVKQMSLEEVYNEENEDLFDPYFDSKSFEERTAEMKAQVLEKLIKQVNQDNKKGEYFASNKADKDNFNKSMTSGTTRISPEGRGSDFVMDERGSFTNTLGKTVSCDPSVVTWLSELNLKNTDKYIRLFAEHEIDMEGLMYISEDQLKEIGIRAIGAYNKILMAIKELQKHRDDIRRKPQQLHYIVDNYDDEEDVSAEAIPVPATRTSVLRQTVTDAKRKPPEIPQPWLNPNRNKSIRSRIDTGLNISPSKPERMTRRDGRGDSAPSTLGQLRGNQREAFKGQFVKASSLSRLHDEHQEQNEGWKMEQASSLNQLSNIGGESRDPYHPKHMDGSVSFLPRPVYRKQKSLDWVSKHSDGSSSGDEFSISSRRQRELLARNANLQDSEPSLGMKIEIRKKSEIVVEEPHVPGQVPSASLRHRNMMDDVDRQKKPVKNVSRQSVALPVVAFGVGIAPSLKIDDYPEDCHTEKGSQKVTRSDQADQKGTDQYSRRSDGSEKPTKKDRPTSRPRTQTLLNSIQDQLDTLQASPIKDDKGTKSLMHQLQSQLVDIQKQVLQTHHQQQQLKASPRIAPPQLPDPLTPHGSNLLLENIRPKRHNQGVTSQRLRVTDNLNVSGRSDSSSDTSSASTGTSPRSNQDRKLSPILRPDHGDLESGPSGRSRPNTSVTQGPPSKTQQEMLREIRKQKDGYRRKIKHLEAELDRLKYKDPVRQMEVNQDEIIFDEKGLIGEGAFSQVFRGNFHGSEVAVKRLKIKLSAQEKNYFTAEVSLMQDLRHPRVVLLLGVCTTAQLPLMILEFMPKGSLYYYLHDPDTQPLDHVAYYVIARDIALGMNYLHQHHPSVLHLDLKSMNVLLSQHLRAKIADFGFSKLRNDANLMGPSGGGKHSVRGTPAWMAPELLDGGDITVKVDVYSFGIILWEMLTRQHPYKGCSLFQVIERVRTKKRPEIPSQCPKSLSTLIVKCWEQLPSKRPTFKEIIPILEQMHFPPQWRMLFSAAGVPASALEDIESTRTLIDIITNSIDQIPPQLSEVDSGRGVSLSPNSGQHSIPDTQVDEGMQVKGQGQHQLPNLALTGHRPSHSVTTDDFLISSIEAVRTANDVSSRQHCSHKPKTPRKPSNAPPPPPPPPPPMHLNPSSPFATPSKPSAEVLLDLMSGIKNVNLKTIPEQPEDSRKTNSPFALAAGDLTKQRDKLKPVQHLPTERTAKENASFLITSGDLAQQKERLRQVKPTNVSQLRNLNGVGHDKLNSMAEILRKAMETRRIVIQCGEPSVDQSLNTVDWSQADF